MENLETLHENNTTFLCSHFYKEKIRFSHGFCFDCPDEVEALKQSIEILKSGQYDPEIFEESVFFAPPILFLNDLYLLDYYKKGKESIIHSIEKEQTKYNNNPYKENLLTKRRFEQSLQDKQQKIIDIDNIINLTTEFRTLINEAFPDLENEFKLKLQEHNDFQKSEAEKTAIADEERRLKREEKQKRIEDNKIKANSEFLITEVERTRLIAIHKYLSDEKYIEVDIDSWLYWFSKQSWTNQKKKPQKIKWLNAAYHLTNVVYLICGNMEVQTEKAMKKTFKLPSGSKFLKLTKANIKDDFYTDIKNMLNWAERFAIK